MTIIIVVGLILLMVYASRSNVPQVKKDCKPHKWVEHKQPDSEDTYLKCAQCDKTPTEIVEGI